MGDFVYLKVSPLRGTIRFHVKGKLAPRFVGPYKIRKRIGKLAYKLELPEELVGVHPVFHVSQLRKCLRVPDEVVPTDTLDIQDTLEYKEHPIRILAEIPKRPEAKLFLCARSNGAITLREKQHGRKSLTSGYIILISSKGTLRFNLGDEILLRG